MEERCCNLQKMLKPLHDDMKLLRDWVLCDDEIMELSLPEVQELQSFYAEGNMDWDEGEDNGECG